MGGDQRWSYLGPQRFARVPGVLTLRSVQRSMGSAINLPLVV